MSIPALKINVEENSYIQTMVELQTHINKLEALSLVQLCNQIKWVLSDADRSADGSNATILYNIEMINDIMATKLRRLSSQSSASSQSPSSSSSATTNTNKKRKNDLFSSSSSSSSSSPSRHNLA